VHDRWAGRLGELVYRPPSAAALSAAHLELS
jgi:hypothetical protein